MKKYFLSKPRQSEVNIMDSVFAEMVLDKALHDFRKKQIQKEIDRSLRNRNKEEFLRLTEELKNIS
ncbi:IDEAL domain-containing protein [Ectobacillus panaciterrae]|uniref:IDEAL domain-containing protein n=1 Tax=Ectobacillus panaciterrae TaxID=363872 RepID=UPI000404C13B|nr:IDEAL domain-containing protein [Ectobacillus panaciterrae]